MKKVVKGKILGVIPFRGTFQEGEPLPKMLKAALLLQAFFAPESTVKVSVN